MQLFSITWTLQEVCEICPHRRQIKMFMGKALSVGVSVGYGSSKLRG